MFQFTTTTVISENKDLTTGLVKFEGAEGVLKVKRLNDFKKDNIEAVYKRTATDPKFAKVKFASLPTTAGFYRIALYVRLSGSQNSYYSNDFVFKGKPFYIEFEVKSGESAATVAKKIATNAKKYILMVYENDLLKITADSSAVTIEAIDEYQRITKADLEKYDDDKEAYVVQSSATVEEVGAEGFGTYTHLMKDLRLPTAANTRWTAIARDEMPVPGVKYNQYTLVYCVNRGIMGGDAVGEVVKSRTTHVFYVADSLATDFENALTTAGVTVTEITDITSALAETEAEAEGKAVITD